MTAIDGLSALSELVSSNELTLEPKRCLNTRFRAVGCTRCAEICPGEGAITLTDGQPVLNHAACLACGLCLHRCPTEAFVQPDRLSDKLVKTVAALPVGPVELICPRHPTPDLGLAPQAVQTQRCLAALAPATLLELSTQERDICLDDTPCGSCPLGQVYPALVQTVAEANSWAALNPYMVPLILRSEQMELRPEVQRSVYEADRPPLSRRGFFGALKQMGAEAVAPKERGELVKAGKTVPVSERLPQVAPQQRVKILDLLEQHAQPANEFRQWLKTSSTLPLADVTVESTRCTACGLCARFCPTGALKFLSDDQTFALTFQPSLCLGEACNICRMACPEEAIVTRPTAISPDIFTKKSLIAGELMPCQRCRQPIARGPELPVTCFICRQNSSLNDLLESLPFHSP